MVLGVQGCYCCEMAMRDMEVVSGSCESGNKEDQETSPTRTATVAVCFLDKLKALTPSNLFRKWKKAVSLLHGKSSCKSTDVVTAAVASAMCCRVFWGEFSGF